MAAAELVVMVVVVVEDKFGVLASRRVLCARPARPASIRRVVGTRPGHASYRLSEQGGKDTWGKGRTEG
eukprot:29117-Pleurochrysis_carterae.AAC.1